MSGYAASYLTGSPWLGVLAAGVVGLDVRLSARARVLAAACLGHRLRHCLDAARHRPCVLSRQAVHPAASAACCQSIDLGALGGIAAIAQRRLHIKPLFVDRHRAGVCAAVGSAQHALGADAAPRRRSRRKPRGPWAIRSRGSGCRDGIGGVFRGRRRGVSVARIIPGSWNEGISSGPGADGGRAGDFRALEPVALPVRRVAVRRALVRSGPRCRRIGVTSGYYLCNAAPYVLTLVIMIINCSSRAGPSPVRRAN